MSRLMHDKARETCRLLFGDIALARRIEAADAAGGAECARTLARMCPELGATSMSVAGGQAVFTGSDSPVTQALGMGMDGPVTSDEFDRMEDFFSSRSAAVNIELCPLADASLVKLLAARGYRLVELSNTLARRIDGHEAKAAGAETVHVREPNPDEVDDWARMIAGGFVEEADPPRQIVDLVASGLQIAGATCHAAELDGQLAGGGTVLVDRGVAALVGQSTAPHLRKKGVQAALIRAGLATAAKAGCDLAVTCTLSGSVSQRNFERQGFRVVYTRSKMRRDWDH